MTPNAQLPPWHLREIPIHDRMKAVNQNSGSRTPSIALAFRLAHLWKRAIRWVTIS